MIHIAVPWGIFGMGNIGDEAMLQGFGKLVLPYKNKLCVWIASHDPLRAAHAEPLFKYYNVRRAGFVRWRALHRSEVYLIVGDTPIMDVLGDWPLNEIATLARLAKQQRKSLFFVGTGSEPLGMEKSRHTVSAILAPIVQHWSVRSERDKARLTDYGVAPERILVAADLGWMLEPVSKDLGREYIKQLGLNLGEPLIGVDITGEPWVLKKQPNLFANVAEFLDSLIDKYSANIMFLSMVVKDDEVFDNAANHKVLSHMKHKDKAFIIPNRYWIPQEILSLLACCHLNVGMRYHFCLLSSLQLVPFIAIDRLGKLEDLCEDINWPYHTSLEDFATETLLTFYSDMEAKRSSIIERLHMQTVSMRKRALANRITIENLLAREEKRMDA